MNPSLHWGILGTGRIASTFAQGVARSQTGRVVAVASRGADKAAAFAAAHSIERAHSSYEALLADPTVQAVYVATPHPQHVPWVVRAAKAGKHVLCEKPLGLNRAEAETAVAACRAHGVLLMEGFMYRCHPQIAKLLELVRGGAIGRVCMIEASFGFCSTYEPASRLWSNTLGGGGILDVGCYPVSFARLVAGAASGQPFLDPEQLSGAGVLHEKAGVDMCAAATLRFANDVIALVSTSITVTQQNTARVLGTTGSLLLPNPWLSAIGGGDAKIVWQKNGGSAPEEIVVTSPPLYALEADTFARALMGGWRDVPAMPVADTLGNMATLDRWREAIGLVYDVEKRVF